MRKLLRNPVPLAAFLLALPLPPDAFGQDRTVLPGGPRVGYQVVASGALKIRRPLGPPERFLQGVPAEPVDAFCWDGRGVTPIEGEIVIDVDPATNSGTVVARWSDEHGEWTYTQQRFLHPEHASGVRIGASVDELRKLLLDPVTTNVYLHGDTTAGQPVLPTVFAYLAAWGPATVTLDGVPFVNPHGLPGPSWLGHLMVTEGVRAPDGTVRVEGGDIYSPRDGSRGMVDPDDLEVHLVFHDARFPRTSNVPPLFSFFYHLNFETVTVSLRGIEEPGRRTLTPEEALGSARR
jgi:hypothetical protein